MAKNSKQQNYLHPIVFKLSKENENRWEVGHILNATIFPPIEVIPRGYGFVYNITTSVGRNKKSYKIKLGDYPSCNYMDFVTMMARSSKGWGK
jgi:hypothetical protein